MKPEISSSPILVLSAILQKVHSLTTHIDTQINIMIAISSAIFIFSTSTLFSGISNGRLSLWVLSFSSVLSVISALFAVHPPRFLRKKGQVESLMYHNKISELASFEDYSLLLTEVLKSEETITAEFAQEIYNVSKYYYRPKRRLFKLARNFLLIGFVLSPILLLLNL